MTGATTEWTVIAILVLGGLGALAACRSPSSEPIGSRGDEEAWRLERADLVQTLRREGISDERVLAAIDAVPRHQFVPQDVLRQAYANRALPIGNEQTISQPYVVAAMTAALELTGDERVLEIGTGSGYQAAVLAELAGAVYSVEIDAELSQRATDVLRRLGYDHVHTRVSDGFFGWPEAAPFDAIMVTAATPRMPERLVEQLAEGGRIIAPIGESGSQMLVVGVKRDGKIEERRTLRVLFVPMTGQVRTPIADAAD